MCGRMRRGVHFAWWQCGVFQQPFHRCSVATCWTRGVPWAWPKETVSIVKAYPDFGEWGANYANDGWTSYKVAENVCE